MMKSPKQNHALSKRPRKPAATAAPMITYHASSYEYRAFPLRAPNGQLTFAGFCLAIWDELSVKRCWKYSTAEQYHSITLNHILPAIQEIASTRALSALYENDILVLWRKITHRLSTHQQKKASYLIRLLLDYAHQKGYTKVVLWALPLDALTYMPGSSALDDIDGDTESPGEREAGLRIIAERKIPKSLPPEVEIRLLKVIADRLDLEGESIGVLLMFATGARPSEACGLCYKHLQEIEPGSDYWLFCRCDITDERRNILMGGKSNNSYRLMVALPFLVRFLKKRRQALQELYPNIDVGELPLACVGNDHFRPCIAEELNRAAKDYFREAGVDPEILLHVYQAIQDKTSNASIDCEALITAYLLRRHFCTLLIFCGLCRLDLKYLMGHALHSTQRHSSDYTNADLFRKISNQLRALPISMVFDDPPSDDPIILDEMKNVRKLWAEIHTESMISKRTDTTAKDITPTAETSESLPPDSSAAAETTEKSIGCGIVTASNIKRIFPNMPLYAYTERRGVQQLPFHFPLKNPRTRGEVILTKKNGSVFQIFSAVPHEDLYILTPDGRLCRLRTKRELSAPHLNGPKDALTQALSSSGIPLQSPLFRETDGTIVCLANTGRIRRVSTRNLKRFKEPFRQLVVLHPGERIISACICKADEDILVATAQGKALRIVADDFLPVASTGSQLYAGIQLMPGDSAAVCIPYHSTQEHLIIKRSGLAIRLSKDFPLSPHSRGSQGRELVKVSTDDSVLTIMPTQKAVLLTNGQRYLCLDTQSIRLVSGISSGVQTMSLHAGEQILSAIGVDSI